MEALIKDDEFCEAILTHHGEKKKLQRGDRFILVKHIVKWLLERTKYPTKDHYVKLAEKIQSVFPAEHVKTWYRPPRIENNKRKSPCGMLYDKVKNTKTFLRKKGKLPPVKRNPKNKKLEMPILEIEYSDEQIASTEWLKRNHEPFPDVRLHWRRCSIPRLKELLTNPKMEPHQYVGNWHDILKLPSSHQLVTDDFEVLGAFEEYSVLKDKSERLMLNWSDFSKKIIKLVESNQTTLSRKEKKAFLKRCSGATDQNNKDYLILQLLASICKQRGRVKVGKTTLKPSAEESKEAFMLHVSNAGDFQEAVNRRDIRHKKLGATVQPYVLVLGDNQDTARASYVVFNEDAWKLSSVLSAIDVCFKTCFSLHCSYPPEARHFWLLIQRYLYGITLEEDIFSESVETLIDQLDQVQEDAD